MLRIQPPTSPGPLAGHRGVPVDRETDDLQVEADWVELIKVSCCCAGDIRKLLEKSWARFEVRIADLIYAVDSWTGERCGLFYGDPATESLPIYDLMPWKRPCVLEIGVNHASDDMEILAQAVWDIKGCCSYPAEEDECCVTAKS
jgi:hypothetical protein